MAIRTIQELKDLYQNGLYPDQFNFEDVFDTMFDLKTGSEILILDHVPLNSEGKLGDMVLIENQALAVHGNLYQRNVFNNVDPIIGEWTAKGNIAGVQGVAGPQGPTGSQGVIGPIGNDGPTGATGPIGPSGLPVDSNFYAVLNTPQVISSSSITLLFGNEIIDIGNDYAPSTGMFTAPVDGKF